MLISNKIENLIKGVKLINFVALKFAVDKTTEDMLETL
jgi:hypothetical protein